MSSLAGEVRAGSARSSAKLPNPRFIVIAGALAAILVGFLTATDPRLGLGGLLAILCIPLALSSLPIGVMLWVPLPIIDAVPFVGLATLGMLLLVTISWVALLPAHKERVARILRANLGLAWAILLLTAWMTATVAWASSPSEAVGNLTDWYISMAFFIAIATSITRPKHLVALVLIIVFATALSTALGFYPIPGSGTEEKDGRISGGLGDPNILAAGIVAAISLTVGLATAIRNSTWRWILAGIAAFLLIGLLATASRGGLLALGISLLVALPLMRSGPLRAGAIIATVVAGLGLWIATTTWSDIGRIREFDTQGTGRSDLWDVAWRMSQDHLAAGVGVNNFRQEAANYVREPGGPSEIALISEDPHVVHNIYLQQLAETGLIGLALFAGVIALALRTTWRSIRQFERSPASNLANLARATLVAQIGVLSASFFLSNSYDPLLWILLALSPVLNTVSMRAQHQARGDANAT